MVRAVKQLMPEENIRIRHHIVRPEEQEKFIEPPYWPTWVLRNNQGKLVKTPNGNVLSSPTRKLAEILRVELISVKQNQNDSLKILELHQNHIDSSGGFFNTPNHLPLLLMDELLSDRSLRIFLHSRKKQELGPDTFAHLDAIFKNNQLLFFTLDDIPIDESEDDLEREPGVFAQQHLSTLTEKNRKRFSKLYAVILEEYVEALGNPKMNLFAILGCHSHNVIHRLLWVMKKITTYELAYIESRLAGENKIPTSNFLEFSHLLEYPDLLHSRDEASERLLKQLPEKFKTMPEEAQLAMHAGLRAMADDHQADFSLAINNFAKSLEIILKTQIFDAWRKKSGSSFLQSHQISTLQNPASKAKKLSNFVQKEPHLIELGAMEFILNLKGGKTEKKEPLLRDFFAFVEHETEFGNITTREFLRELRDIRVMRNRKSHSEVSKSGEEPVVQFLHVVRALELLLDD